MPARARRLAALAALAGTLACARAPERGGPVPLSIVPGQSTGEPVAVEIAGRAFEAAIHSDFGRTGGASLDVRFSAELLPVAGGAPVALADVTLTASRTLRATVPGGLTRGAYQLRVTDPEGRAGVLDRAFRVVAPAEAVAAFRVDVLEPPRAGVPFPVALTAVDPQGMVVDGFEGSVSVADVTGTASPTSAGPFAAGRFQLHATVPGLAAGDRIVVSDALGRTGASDPFDVAAGPPAALVFPGRSATVAAGACSAPLDLELRDALGHPAPADADVAAALQAAPPDVGFFSDAACSTPLTSLTIAAGSSRAAFHLRAGVAGTVTVRAVPATLPSASQHETVTP